MARVRSKDNALGRLLASAPIPVYALDEQRRIIYCNTACGQLVGMNPDELIGHRCDYRATQHGSAAPDIAASLCPPPEVFSGESVRADVTLLHASGTLLDRCVEYQPLGDDALHCVGVLATVHESTAACRGGATEAAELHRSLLRLRRLISADPGVDELIGASPAIQRVRDQIELASRGRTRVLVHGPSGSGREHVARLLHRRASPDPFAQLVPLCCPLLDAELLQTTITALVRQAESVPGRSDTSRRSVSHAPTLLLLEVDQLTDEAQGELGGFLTLPGFELYSIATSEESLVALAERGRFRPDLAHALSTLAIHLPPLAQRLEDIGLLSQYFVEKFNAQGDRQLSGFSAAAMDELAGYAWPDNIDELADLVELACRAAEGPVIEVGDLPAQIRWATTADAHPRQQDEPIVLDEFLAEIEQELMRRALRRCKGNKTRAARLLGINRARLLRRLGQFGIS